MYKYLPLLFLLIFSANGLQAQTVEGIIIDNSADEPLAGATILETGTTNGTTSNENGEFSLALRSADNSLTVSFVGFRTKEINISDPNEFLEIHLETQPILSGEVFVNALRVDESTPMSFSNISRDEIESRNLGQDIPFLVNTTPSVVSTSDAGAGVGYTGIRIRGVDPGRINVTINGIPLNDAESHGVFWVNMPDLASSTQNIQIQRGVGTSTHGAGAFGGSMNLQTAIMNPDPYGEINTSLGAFGTQKANVQLGSGILDNGWQFEGRLSKIESDGYIDRASSDLKSFYLSGSRHGENSLLKADVFSGQEVTYQAWNGVPEPIINNDAQELEEFITNLFLGEDDANRLRNNLGNRQFNEFTYENQVDNYQQDHYQLHYSYQLDDNWIANTSLHYTYGRGYFEQFRDNDRLSTYGIDPVQIGGETITRSDLIRRRWLDNHFYGGVFSTELNRPDRWKLTVGGGYNEYDGDHFGEVIWARFAGDSDIGDRYYDNNGFKTDFNIYSKFNYFISQNLNIYADLQYRTVSYRFLGLRIDDATDDVMDVTQRDRINFINPKAGIVYRFADGHRAFFSYSVGGKEPTRRDYVESTEDSRPDPERLFNYELGYNASFNRYEFGVNFYYMKYRDQLILTGAVNDVGNYVRDNVPDSYRAGIELQASAQLLPQLNWSGNATFSQNKINEYVRFLDDFDQGGQQTEVFDDVDIAFSPSTILNSIFSHRLGNLTSELTTKYVSQQFLDNTQSEERSIDSYLVNDLRFSYNFGNVPYVRTVTATLQVNNIFDEEYESNGYTFGWISGGQERSFNYLYPQAGRHVMANLSVRF